jgi:nickel superoxide dismutase
MRKKGFQLAATGLILLAMVAYAAAHCEIPCGIYDDEMRVNAIAEHITTIEKSMNQILKLQKTTPVNYNQLVRWIMNKEDHANQLQEIVTQYFMTQRIKPDTSVYEKQVLVLHQMLIAAMKCKQTSDLSHVSKLRTLLESFHDLYFGHSHQ